MTDDIPDDETHAERMARLAAKYDHGQPDHEPSFLCFQCRAEGVTPDF